jgi:hypothetical protein
MGRDSIDCPLQEHGGGWVCGGSVSREHQVLDAIVTYAVLWRRQGVVWRWGRGVVTPVDLDLVSSSSCASSRFSCSSGVWTIGPATGRANGWASETGRAVVGYWVPLVLPARTMAILFVIPGKQDLSMLTLRVTSVNTSVSFRNANGPRTIA